MAFLACLSGDPQLRSLPGEPAPSWFPIQEGVVRGPQGEPVELAFDHAEIVRTAWAKR